MKKLKGKILNYFNGRMIRIPVDRDDEDYWIEKLKTIGIEMENVYKGDCI